MSQSEPESEGANFMERAVHLSLIAVESNLGGPFGCVIVKDGKIIGEGHNLVSSTHDPTAHGEVVAIRDACKNIKNHNLAGCDVYTSSFPCPMCLGAITWAGCSRVFYANSKQDAAKFGFEDDEMYEDLKKPISDMAMKFIHIPNPFALKSFECWRQKMQKSDSLK